MGSACCKNLDSESPSPHLPFCEVVRRFARVMCPVDPPQQKPVFRARKYGLTDIVGPVVKKDSWAQTDPQPPPRYRRGKQRDLGRRRSRSVEFLPYLIQREEELRSANSAGSLEDIPGQEDVLDFQMYFMSRLPKNSIDEGKVVLTDKKKEFLSGLLGEENNNLILSRPLDTIDIVKEKQKEDSVPLGSSEEPAIDRLLAPNETPGNGLLAPNETPGNGLLAPNETPGNGGSSRRSSITESLREFESSLLDMLEEEEASSLSAKDLGPEEDDEEEQEVVKMMTPLKKKDLPTLKEEKEEDYVISPLEDEGEDETKTTFVPEIPKELTKSKESNINENPTDKNTSENIDKPSNTETISKPTLKDQPPTITIEIVS